jgi:Predicted transcriptional regulators
LKPYTYDKEKTKKRLQKARTEKSQKTRKPCRQTDVARDLTITQTAYSYIETGKRPIYLEEAIRIANYFGESFEYLFLGESE